MYKMHADTRFLTRAYWPNDAVSSFSTKELPKVPTTEFTIAVYGRACFIVETTKKKTVQKNLAWADLLPVL